MKLTVTNNITLEGVPPALGAEVREALTVENPAWVNAKRYGRRKRVFQPRHLRFYQEAPDGTLQIPRGSGRQFLRMARSHGLEMQVEDRTRLLPPVPFAFKGSLKPFQKRAVADILKRPCGVLSSPTGSGKTCVALAVIAERKQPTLIVVHTRELLNQWVSRIGTFLGIPAEQVGVIGNGRKDLGKRISVGVVNSVYKVADEVSPHIGHLIVDECHRTPSRTFTQAVSAFDARYLLGLSATPWRRDRLSKLIFWHLGDQAHEVEPEALRESGDILKATVEWRETDFTTDLDPREEYSAMLSELTKDQARNELIASDVAKEAEAGGGIVLVLTDRKAHVSALASLLEARNVRTACLTGDLSGKARAEAMDAITTGRARVLCATQALVGEGLDLPALSTLFLGTPVRFDGRLLQSVGRILRPAPGKDRAVVYDYHDGNVGQLVNAARARARVYEQHTASARRAAA